MFSSMFSNNSIVAIYIFSILFHILAQFIDNNYIVLTIGIVLIMFFGGIVYNHYIKNPSITKINIINLTAILNVFTIVLTLVTSSEMSNRWIGLLIFVITNIFSVVVIYKNIEISDAKKDRNDETDDSKKGGTLSEDLKLTMARKILPKWIIKNEKKLKLTDYVKIIKYPEDEYFTGRMKLLYGTKKQDPVDVCLTYKMDESVDGSYEPQLAYIYLEGDCKVINDSKSNHWELERTKDDKNNNFRRYIWHKKQVFSYMHPLTTATYAKSGCGSCSAN